jgi:hypothetical protein
MSSSDEENIMTKRRKKIKLSKAQKLDNDTNKWLAKKDAAIEQLVKAMEHLKTLGRSQRRLQKAELHPVQRKIAYKLNKATLGKSQERLDKAALVPPPTKIVAPRRALGEAPEAGLDVVEDRTARMEGLGFRSTKRRKKAAAPVASD